jgi:4-amino-4-deoxy-L-arabinose transferase-like glycosyltransferase
MRSQFVVRSVSAAPVLVPVFFAVLTAVCTAMTLFEAYDGKLAALVALVLTVALGRVVGLGERVVTRKALVVDLLAIGLALSFAVINARYAAQNIVVSRDPGTYGVTAQWLVHHSSLDIDAQRGLFGNALGYAGAGFGVAPQAGHLYAQGLHGLPEVLAVGGSLFGTALMYKLNCLIGGLALLAVYGFARQVVGRWPALIAAGLLGLTLPQIAFSRDNYTEPLSQLLLVGGLALLWLVRPGQTARWGVAGLVLGASCLTRIDAFLVLPPLVLYAAVRLAVTAPGERRVALRDSAALLAGAAIPAYLGLRDLQDLSYGYYRDLHSQFSQIFLFLYVSLAVAVVAVAVGWGTRLLPWFEAHGTRWRARAGDLAAAGVVVVGVLLAIRPLFVTVHGNDSGQAGLIGALQRSSRQTFDPLRTYAENSVTWLAWYAGPVATALALIGVALLVRRLIRNRRLELLPFLTLLLVTALLYLVAPKNTPDQIWVMRRYVPIVIPGLIIAAMLVLAEALQKVKGQARTAVAVVAGIALFAPVAYISKPFLTIREGTPQLQEIQRVCDTLPDGDGVVVIGDMGARYIQTIRAFCLTPAANYPTVNSNALAVAQQAFAARGHQLWILGADDVEPALAHVSTVGAPVIFNQLNVNVWAKALETPPRGIMIAGRNFYLGRVGPDGKVDRWTPSYDGIPKSAAKPTDQPSP